MMSIPPQDRLTKDIDILEKATSFLTYFQNIKLDDPDNEFDTHRKTCHCLMHAQLDKGALICKHSRLSLSR